MKYYVTIYIDPFIECFLDYKEKCFWDRQDFPHAFLGLTRKHPDDLDKIDEELKQEKLKNANWKDFDKK